MQDEYKIERRPAGDRPEPDAMKRKMVGEGYGVFQWSDAPGTVYGLHEHPTDQSHCSGRLELDFRDAGTFVLGSGIVISCLPVLSTPHG